MSSPSPPPLKRPRRFWPRFTLRVLLAVMTALCIGLAIWTHRAREQARIVKHIEEHYGTVMYDWEPQPAPKMNDARSPVPAWLLDRLGEDFFHQVVWAHVRGDVDMEQVSRLTAIRELTIWKEDLTDDMFRPIANLRKLRKLTIQSDMHQSLGDYPDTTHLGDPSLSLIAQMPRLEQLYVDGMGFTAEGLAALAESQSLRSVWINHCHTSVTPADVQPLLQTGRLQRIMVRKWTEGIGEEEVMDW
jgi:hypothetical protein